MKKYSAPLTLICFALLFMGLHRYGLSLQEQYPHGEEPANILWLTETMENMQSEVWQIVIAGLAFWLGRWQGAPEDKGEMEQIKMELSDIRYLLANKEWRDDAANNVNDLYFGGR